MNKDNNGFVDANGGMGLSSGFTPTPPSPNDVKDEGIFLSIIRGIGKLFNVLVSGYKENQELVKKQMLINQNKSNYTLIALELHETLHACATATSIVPPTPSNLMMPYDGLDAKSMQYRVLDNGGANKPIKDSISATINHVLDERYRQRLSILSFRLFVKIDFGPNGYILSPTGANMTNAPILSGFSYGKKVGRLFQDEHGDFHIVYFDRTSRYLPLGAHFKRFYIQTNSWVDETIDYTQFNPIMNQYCGFYYFVSSGKPVEPCFAKA